MTQVVLITGEPGHGKSYLASKLHARHGGEVICLDAEYAEFVKRRYPSLYLPDLACVISQHYKTVLSVKRQGKSQWRKHVVGLVEAAIKRSKLVIVEGYLLAIVLDDVLDVIPDSCSVVNVVVRDRRYYVESGIKDLQAWFVGSGAYG